MKGETARLNKMRETIQRKLRNVEDQKADVEQQKETLKSQIIGLERGRDLSIAYVNGIFAIICRSETIDLCITIKI